MVALRRLGLLILVIMAQTRSVSLADAVAAEFPFVEDFESLPEGSVDGLDVWSVAGGEAAVAADSARFGVKALKTGEGSEVALAIAGAENVVWLDLWIMTSGGPFVPAISPLPKKSAVLVFDCLEGIQALDGDGTGGGAIVNSGIALDGGGWHRISVKLDFNAKKWDLYVDGLRRLTDLGFHSSDVTGLSGMVRTACAQSHLDALSFTSVGLMDDTDQDGLGDLDEMKVYRTNPSSPDTDGDGMRDGDEVLAGTQPTDERSFFYLDISAQDSASIMQLCASTVEGKVYELQATEDIGIPDSWHPVANFMGDGLSWVWVVGADPAAARCFYRLVVLPE